MLFVLFGFSVCAEPESADQVCVLFSLITPSASALTPAPISPSAPSLFVALWPSLPLFMKCGSTLYELPKGDPGKAFRYPKCYNRWNSCRVMGVSVQTCSLRTDRCMSVLSFIAACVFVSSPPHDTSVNTSLTHTASVAYVLAHVLQTGFVRCSVLPCYLC